ncbi:Endonuclease/exonuclease/phosphatase, partial [Fistulina hepatica ATCC 64428]
EVDRLEKLEPVLETAGYAWHYKCGPGKMHGCLIAYKKNAFRLVRDRLIEYDSQPVRMSDTDTVNCYGRSFTTKNIGSLLALQRIDDVPTGIVVATTHLFWHPKYTYERTRQCGILLREVIKFRDEIFPDKKIPCVITGDFNFQPDDAAYSLLSGDDLLSGQEERILSSMVVHKSVDPRVPATEKSDMEEEEAGDPDRVITNARLATPSDGLLSVAELQNFFGTLPSVVSAYNVGLGCARDMNPLSGLRTFGDRVGIPATRRGRHEPEWTSYTHYWKSVLGKHPNSCIFLDYIFVVNPPDTKLQVAGLLRPHQTTALEPGLPQQGVCGSDHVSLCAELAWTPTTSSDH